MILVALTFWLTSTAYVIHWYYKNGETAFGVVLMALLLGPILVFIVKDNEKEIKKSHPLTSDLESHHRRWFQLSDRINQERMQSNWGRTIPPPPPISPPPNRRPNIKTKDFKFFQK